MPSKRKISPVVGRDGISGVRGAAREQDVAVIEIDSNFGRVLGLADGQKVKLPN
jgi:peroxin-1